MFYLNSFSEWFKRTDNALLDFLGRCGENVFPIYLYQGFGAMAVYPVVRALSEYHWLTVLSVAFAGNLALSLFLAHVFGYTNDMISRKTNSALSRLLG